MLSTKTLDYLWKPPQETFLCLMASASPTFARGKLTHPRRAKSFHARKPAPSCWSTLWLLLHTRGSFFNVLLYVCSTLPWSPMLSSDGNWNLVWSVSQSTWISLWTLGHWSEPVKFTENSFLNPDVLSQSLRATCSPIDTRIKNHSNNNNCHLPHAINF